MTALWGLENELPPSVSDARTASVENSTKVYSEKLWRLVKFFELHEEFNMTGFAPHKYGSFALPRSWANVWRTVFDTSPQMSGLESPHTGSKTGSNSMNHAYLGNAWYHMQLLLNAGQRNGYGHSVIPWEYVPGFLAPLNKEVGDKLPGFALIWTRKGLDEGDNGHTPKEMIGWHFSRARLNFLNLFDYENGKTFNKFWFEKQTPEGKKVLDLFVQVAAEKDASWLAEQYPRRDNWASVAPRDPQDCSDSVHEDGAHWSSPKFRVDLPMTYDCEVRSIAVSTFSFLKLASERKSFHPALINSRVPSSCHLSADYRTEMA